LFFEDNLEDLFADACNEAVQRFRETDEVYNQAIKRRAELSPVIAMLTEHDGDILLSDAQRKSMAEYIALLTGPKEFEVLMACYEHGMCDCLKLMKRLDALKER
jgi:hypothetical protein